LDFTNNPNVFYLASDVLTHQFDRVRDRGLSINPISSQTRAIFRIGIA
jgi:hypothetical protein